MNKDKTNKQQLTSEADDLTDLIASVNTSGMEDIVTPDELEVMKKRIAQQLKVQRRHEAYQRLRTINDMAVIEKDMTDEIAFNAIYDIYDWFLVNTDKIYMKSYWSDCDNERLYSYRQIIYMSKRSKLLEETYNEIKSLLESRIVEESFRNKGSGHIAKLLLSHTYGINETTQVVTTNDTVIKFKFDNQEEIDAEDE